MIYIFKIMFHLLERQFGRVVIGTGRGAVSEAGGVSSRHGVESLFGESEIRGNYAKVLFFLLFADEIMLETQFKM